MDICATISVSFPLTVLIERVLYLCTHTGIVRLPICTSKGPFFFSSSSHSAYADAPLSPKAYPTILPQRQTRVVVNCTVPLWRTTASVLRTSSTIVVTSHLSPRLDK